MNFLPPRAGTSNGSPPEKSSTARNSSSISSPSAPAAGRAGCRSNWPSFNTSFPGSPACGTTFPARAAASAPGAPVKHSSKSTAAACRRRIGRLEGELSDVRKHRSIQRAGRRRHSWPVAAIVGYTNAGKSTLLEPPHRRRTSTPLDKLFATLDPTTRQFILPNNQKVLLTDTVGFIRKLPHTVIESFKATLEEVREADLLIHVVDTSHPGFPRPDERRRKRHRGNQRPAANKPSIIFNKADLVRDPDLIAAQLRRIPGSVAVSARTGFGVDQMLQELETRLTAWRLRATYRIPASESALLAEIHRSGHVLEISYEENTAFVRANVPPELQAKLAPWLDAQTNGAGHPQLC